MSDESPYTVVEVCPCGARFDLTGPYWQYLEAAVREWRKEHQHPQKAVEEPHD